MYDLPNADDRQLWTFDVDTRNVRLENFVLIFQIQNCVGYVLNKGTVDESFVAPEKVLAEVLKKTKSIAEV